MQKVELLNSQTDASDVQMLSSVYQTFNFYWIKYGFLFSSGVRQQGMCVRVRVFAHVRVSYLLSLSLF